VARASQGSGEIHQVYWRGFQSSPLVWGVCISFCGLDLITSSLSLASSLGAARRSMSVRPSRVATTARFSGMHLGDLESIIWRATSMAAETSRWKS
jgi:hypothetical protein